MNPTTTREAATHLGSGASPGGIDQATIDRLAASAFIAGSERQPIAIAAPFSGRLLARIPRALPDDVHEAARRARAAQPGWAALPPAERARVLLGFHERLLDQQERVADLIQLESGKARWHAIEEVLYVAIATRHYALHGASYLRPRRRRVAFPFFTTAREYRQPVGIVGIISPWNFPLVLGAGDLMPALMAGNGALLRPDEQSALTALWIADQLRQAGLPEGVLHVITGDGPVVGPALVGAVDYIMFTGSTRVGRVVARQAAERLIGCSLELGGKNAMIVLEDADIEKAVDGAVRGAFVGAGQVCVSIERAYVHRSIYDRFVARLLERVRSMRLSSDLAYGTDMGSLTVPRQLENVRAHLDDALEKGATLLAGGRARPDLGPLFFEPTVLANVAPAMRVHAEETFGPILSLYPFADVDDALRRANDSEYGLNASVWSRSPRRALAVARQLRTGTVNINESYASTWAAIGAPMGGMKASGIGRRQGAEGILKYTEAQTVTVQRGLALAPPPPPFTEPRWARVLNLFLRASRHLLRVLLAAALLGAPPLVAQQQLTTGTLVGRITDRERRPVAGAAITLRNEATGVIRHVIADERGRYVVPLIPAGGPWSLTVESIGYGTVEQSGLRVGAGEVLTRDVELVTTPVAVAAIEVNVAGIRAVERGGIVERVTERQMARLPVRGRGFTEFLNLSPLVSAQPEVETGGRFAVGGARASGTSLQVDGVDTNNLFFAESQGSARSPFAYSLESIGEIQLITNGFDVEYGNYQGGIVNAITRSGTNERAGTAFLFHRDAALTANDFAGRSAAGFRTSQFGLALSGPVVRDRLHWFLALDLQERRVPVEAASIEGTGVRAAEHAAVVQALGNVYGLADPGRWFGSFSDVEDNAVAFLRLDWNLSADHRLTLRYNGSRFFRRFDGLDRYDAITSSAGFTDRVSATVAELNSVLGSRVTHSLRLQHSREDRPRTPHVAGGYLPRIDVDNLTGENGGTVRLSLGGDDQRFRNRLEETKLQLVDNLTWRLGRHTLKLGTSDILSATRHENWVSGNGTYLFPNETGLAARDPVSFSRLARACPVPLTANRAGETVICPEPDVPVARFDAVEWSAYVQDEWRLTDRLTLVGGVRWGGTRLDRRPGAVPGLESAFGVSSTVVPSFRGLSPRMAFSWESGDDASRVLRGGAGLLTGRAPLVLAGNAFETERPLLRVFCERESAPTLDIAELLAAPRGLANPAACRSGSQRTGRPQYTVFAEDFALPRTLKANIGWETRLGADTRVSIDLLHSRTSRNFHVTDLNLAPPRFRLRYEIACDGCDGRPVFVPLIFGPLVYTPRKAAGVPRLRDTGFDRVFRVTSDGEARATSVLVEVQHLFGDRLEVAARYAHNRAFDNSSFSCCTSHDGFSLEPTAGDPSFIGDPGDGGPGTWGPSATERRHVLVASALASAPFGFRIDAVLRIQSGVPWTPIVAGDLNGDGEDRNDRPWLGRGLALASAADSALWQNLLDDDPCLRHQVGLIAGRNTCRNPWWNALDLRLSREFAIWRLHKAELSLDFYNVLNGLSSTMGQYAVVYGERRVLLSAVQYRPPASPGEIEPDAEKVIYRVNPGFGRLRPIGFDPLQFQAQLGLRYRF